MKRVIAALLMVALAACGGDGDAGAGPDAVVRAYFDAAFDGRSSAAYDLLHPGIQATTTRDEFIACAAKASTGTVTPKVDVTEETAVKYVRRDGASIDATAVSVKLSAGQLSETYTVWIADGRIVDSKPAGDTPCAQRL